MKISRKCRHDGRYDDDVSHMSEVNKGAQKIMIAVPDQLALVFAWSLLTGVFIIVLLTATYVVLRFESPPPPQSAALAARTIRCLNASILHPLVTRQDIQPGDVHYVFVDDERISRLSACSLESAVNSAAASGNGRVNVFVVGGIRRVTLYNPTLPAAMSLWTTLANLNATYGDHRLNVTRVSLDECLECSPFQGMDLSGHPELAKFAVQLAVLWQFGGTVLGDGVLVIRKDVFRVAGAAVQYGDRIISSPVACHAFVYDAMLNAKKYACGSEPFGPDTGLTIINETATGVDARPVSDWVVCRGGVVDDRCYYAEAAMTDLRRGYNYCPVAVGRKSVSPDNRETTQASAPAEIRETARPSSPKFKEISRASSPTEFQETVVRTMTDPDYRNDQKRITGDGQVPNI